LRAEVHQFLISFNLKNDRGAGEQTIQCSANPRKTGDSTSIDRIDDIATCIGRWTLCCHSIGLASNFPDIWRFLRFISGFRDQTRLTIGAVTFDIESCRIIRDGS
jgi:hypothetical protein